MPLPIANGNEAQLPAWRWREVLRVLPSIDTDRALVQTITNALPVAGDANRAVRIRLTPAQIALVERAVALLDLGR